MCMFCTALPMVVGATAVVQGEQRKKIQAAQSLKLGRSADSKLPDSDNVQLQPRPARTRLPSERIWLTPKRVSGFGALAFVFLLFGSGLYHTHFPG